MLAASAVVVSLAIALAVALFGEEPRVKPWFIEACLSCAARSAGLWSRCTCRHGRSVSIATLLARTLALAASERPTA